MKDKILIVGYTSNLASKFVSHIRDTFEIHLFNRKTNKLINTKHKVINGNPLLICDNDFIDNDYKFIINYIFLRGENIHDNIIFCESLVRLCNKQQYLKKLIHVSSTMVHGFQDMKIKISCPPKANRNLYGYSLIKAESERYLVNNYDKTHVIRLGFVQSRIDYSIIIKKIFHKAIFFKGTKFRNIPITKESTVIDSIYNHIFDDDSPKLTIEIDNQLNISSVSKKHRQAVFYIPYPFFKVLLTCSVFLKFKKLEFKLRNLNNRIIYDGK